MKVGLLKNLLTVLSGTFLLVAFSIRLFEINITSTVIYYLSILSGGYFVLISAVRCLVKQKFLNINFLVVVATLGAIYINQIGEAAAVVFFFSLAELFEDYGIEKSKKAVETLIKKAPKWGSCQKRGVNQRRRPS